ncbi:hypothetical protein [Enterococcus faecalis]|uniref:hypothetical protein n=1 Tax=Enterococcus faecalis TaxID=1351 RepID=UPI0030C837C6
MFELLKNNWFELPILIFIYPGYKGIKKSIENGLSELPQRLHEKKLEEIRNENSNIMQDKEHQTTRELQVDNYYRSISGKKIEDLFSRWMDMIADTEKIENLKPAVLNKMIKELMMYGSARTVYIGSLFQQYNYKRPSTSDEFNAFELLYLGASLVASMKQDFTGYEVDPEVLLRMKITDIDSEINKERFKLAKENASKIIEDGFI